MGCTYSIFMQSDRYAAELVPPRASTACPLRRRRFAGGPRLTRRTWWRRETRISLQIGRDWIYAPYGGTQGEVSYVPKMRTQLVAARTVAQALADLATGPESAPATGSPRGTDPGDRRSAGGKPCRHGDTARGEAQ